MNEVCVLSRDSRDWRSYSIETEPTGTEPRGIEHTFDAFKSFDSRTVNHEIPIFVVQMLSNFMPRKNSGESSPLSFWDRRIKYFSFFPRDGLKGQLRKDLHFSMISNANYIREKERSLHRTADASAWYSAIRGPVSSLKKRFTRNGRLRSKL